MNFNHPNNLRDDRENSSSDLQAESLDQNESQSAETSAVLIAIPSGTDPSLSQAERDALHTHESVIEGGLRNPFNIGRALKAISEGKLYREHYPSFEEYLAKRWDLGRSYGYSHIDAANVYDLIAATSTVLPTNEFQVRPLAKLESDLQPKAWEAAIDAAKKSGRSAPTGADVKQAVADIQSIQEMQRRSQTEDSEQDRSDFQNGDPLVLLPKLEAMTIDLLLISDLNCSSPSKAAARLGELLDAAGAATKDDHQVLVFSDLYDNRELIAAAEQRGYEFGVVLHWDSSAERKPIPWSAMQSTEDILHFRRGSAQFAGKCGNVINCDRKFPKLHPRQRPRPLIELLVATATAPGMLVVDPTAGVATTNLVCLQLGRNCVGIEENAELFAQGLSRLKQLTDQAHQL